MFWRRMERVFIAMKRLIYQVTFTTPFIKLKRWRQKPNLQQVRKEQTNCQNWGEEENHWEEEEKAAEEHV